VIVDQNPLLEACFQLTAATMWEPKRLTAEEIQSHIEELDQMTTEYYDMAQGLQCGDVTDDRRSTFGEGGY
jgi:hypothetical protein